MGELSKKIGEIGENITANFFELIGWENSLPNESLKCLKPQKHARKESKTQKRETHGIDFLYNYRSALESNTINNLIISVKNSNETYPNSPVRIFKEHIQDLAHTTECFNRSPLKTEQLKKYHGYKRTNDIGVLFWLSHNDETYHDVVSKLENCQLDKELKFSTIYVVDNKRIEFIFSVINHLRSSFSDHDVLFYYPKTSLNYSDTEITQFGKSLPVEYLNSPVIPFLLRKGNSEVDTLCIATSDNFDEEELPQLIQAAREYTNEITCNYLFLFPNYIRSQHHSSVLKAISSFENKLNNKVDVMSFNPDYRSLNNV